MATPDALDLLRASIASNLPATLLTATGEQTDALASAASLSFPQASGDPIVLPKDAPTRYLRTDAKSAADSASYTVGQLWLAWTERDTGVRDYLVKGQAAGGFVAITDRRDVVLFLQGSGDGGARVAKKGEEGKAAPVAAPAEAAPVAEAEAGPSRPAAAPKRKYEVDVADREFCKRLRAEEVELQDRNSVLRKSSGGKVNNFSSFLQTVMSEKIRALRKSFDSGGRVAPQPQPSMAPSSVQRKTKSVSPIILISSAPTALVTMWNVKKFLEQGVFEQSDVARQNAALQGNTRAEDVIRIERKRSGPTGDVTSSYYVVDSVEALQKFGADAWDRVICVVTTGQAWQFKPYKWMDPKVLFRNVKGMYFQWHNEPVNPAIREWNVTEMRIDRFKRHTDRQVVAEFWRVLDAARRR